jgi:hypothetical protein
MISNSNKEPYQVDPSDCISFRCYLVWRNNLGCPILKIVSLDLTLENSIKELYLAPPLNYISFQYCSTRLSRKGDSHWRFFSLFLDILDSIREIFNNVPFCYAWFQCFTMWPSIIDCIKLNFGLVLLIFFTLSLAHFLLN